MASLRAKVDKFAIKVGKFAQVFRGPHTVDEFAIKVGKFATKLDKFVYNIFAMFIMSFSGGGAFQRSGTTSALRDCGLSRSIYSLFDSLTRGGGGCNLYPGGTDQPKPNTMRGSVPAIVLVSWKLLEAKKAQRSP